MASPLPRLRAENVDSSPAVAVQGVVEPWGPWKHDTLVEASGAPTRTCTESRSVNSLVPKTL